MKDEASFQIKGAVVNIREFEKSIKVTVSKNTYRKNNEDKLVRTVKFTTVTILGDKNRKNFMKSVAKGDHLHIDGTLEDTRFEKQGVQHYSVDVIATRWAVMDKKRQSKVELPETEAEAPKAA